MRKLFLALSAMSTLSIASVHAESMADNSNFKKSAVIVVASIVCGIGTPSSDALARTYFELGVIETRLPADVAVVITQSQAHKILDYIVANQKVTEFCGNAKEAKW